MATAKTPGRARNIRPTGDQRTVLEGKIRTAAIQEFATHGFAGARVERISRAAGTVDRMIYYYFGSKEKLYRAVLEQVYGELIDAQRRFQLPDDPVEAMRELILHSWDHYQAHPALVRLLMNENLGKGRHFQASEAIREASMPLLQTTEAILTRGREAGVFRDDVSTAHALMTIMSLGFFYLSNQYTCSTWIGVDLGLAEQRAQWREHIVTVVLDYLRARPALAMDRAQAQAQAFSPPASASGSPRPKAGDRRRR